MRLGITEFSDESTTWDACDGVTVGSLSQLGFLLMCPGMPQRLVYIPAIHLGDLGCVTSFQLQHDPGSTVAGIYGMNQ